MIAEEFRLSKVSAVREQIQELPGYLTIEEKNELLGSLLTVPVVTPDVNVAVTRLNGETRSYLVPAFTSVEDLKSIIANAEGIPTGQMTLIHGAEGQSLARSTVMGTLVDEKVSFNQTVTSDCVDDDALGDAIANMPAFDWEKQISNESVQSNQSCHSNVELTMVRQARKNITKFTARADVSDDGKCVSLKGPATVLLEDCGAGTKVLVRLLARGAEASYLGVCDINANLDQKLDMEGCCAVCSTDHDGNMLLCHDGRLQELPCRRFVCGDVLSIKLADDSRSIKVTNNGNRCGRFQLDWAQGSTQLAIALGGGTGTKWQLLDSSTPELYAVPRGVPLVSHWDMNHSSVDASFKRVSFFENRRGTVMLKGCGHGSTAIARAMQMGDGHLYIGVCDPAFALSVPPSVPGAYALLSTGDLIANGNRIASVFPGFAVGDVLVLTVSADGTAYAIAKNGVGQIVVNNIPAVPEHVICLGGSGPCLWELA